MRVILIDITLCHYKVIMIISRKLKLSITITEGTKLMVISSRQNE